MQAGSVPFIRHKDLLRAPSRCDGSRILQRGTCHLRRIDDPHGDHIAIDFIQHIITVAYGRLFVLSASTNHRAFQIAARIWRTGSSNTFSTILAPTFSSLLGNASPHKPVLPELHQPTPYRRSSTIPSSTAAMSQQAHLQSGASPPSFPLLSPHRP